MDLVCSPYVYVYLYLYHLSENEEDVVMKPRLTPGGVRVADRLGITRRGQQTNDGKRPSHIWL